MNRTATNTIRFMMDELLPPFIRDNRYFMYPFFHYWFKGKNVKLFMEFKSMAYDLTDEEYARIYQELDCRATDRTTDLSSKCLTAVLDSLDETADSIVDIGCGRGHFLRELKKRTNLDVHACDLYESIDIPDVGYTKGNLENLPFEDDAFDIVTCFHTLEHVRNPAGAVSELKRIAGKQLVIVVPKQRYYYYTLDLHLSFFHTEAELAHLVGLNDYTCRNVMGDWVYVGRVR